MYDVNLKIVDQLIQLQRSSLKLYIYYTAGIIVLGILLATSGQLFFENPTVKTIVSSGGTIITSFSGFSFKEFLNKKENINLYNAFKSNIEIYKEDSKRQEQFEISLQNYLFKK
jgi:hypothetical protein